MNNHFWKYIPSRFFAVLVIVALAAAGLPVAPVSAAPRTAAAPLNNWPATPTQTATTGNPTAANFTVSAGTACLLVVAIASYDSNNSSGQTFAVTYGGSPLTQAFLENSNRRQTWIGWRALGDSASNTTQSLAVSVTGTHTNVVVWAASYSGINQTSPITDSGGTYFNNSDFGAIGGPLTVNAGGYGIYGWAGTGGITRTSDTETYTEHSDVNNPATFNYGMASKAFSTTGNTNPSVTWSGRNRASVSFITLNPAPLVTTTAGIATATAVGSTSINVSMPYTDDSNANNTYTVDYKLTVDSTWTNWVTAAAHTASPYATTITGLAGSSSYDVRITYNDADGVTGTNPQTITPVTTAAVGVSTLQAWTNVYHGTSTVVQNITYTVPAGTGVNRVMAVAIASSMTGVGARTVTLTYGGQSFTSSVNGDMATTTVRQHTQLY